MRAYTPAELRRAISHGKLTRQQLDRLIELLNESEKTPVEDALFGGSGIVWPTQPSESQSNQHKPDSTKEPYSEEDLVAGLFIKYSRPRGSWLPPNFMALTKTTETPTGGTVWCDPADETVGWILTELQAEKLEARQKNERCQSNPSP